MATNLLKTAEQYRSIMAGSFKMVWLVPKSTSHPCGSSAMVSILWRGCDSLSQAPLHTHGLPVEVCHIKFCRTDRETICVLSGENATDTIESSWLWSGGRASAPDTASHNQMEWSCDPEAIQVPSGENVTAEIMSVWPWSSGSTSAPDSASHICTVLSADLEATRLPSAENAME